MPWRPLEQDVLWVLCPQLLALPGQVDDGRVVEDEPCRTTGLVRDLGPKVIIEHLDADSVQAFRQPAPFLDFLLGNPLENKVLGIKIRGKVYSIEHEGQTTL